MKASIIDEFGGVDVLKYKDIATPKPCLDRTLPLSQAAEAHRLILTDQLRGNIVLLPWAE